MRLRFGVLVPVLLVAALPALARDRASRISQPNITFPAGTCLEGSLGDLPGAGFEPLHASELDPIVRAAAASLPDAMTVAVVDRTGVPLAIYRKNGAPALNDDLAVGVARTAALFSHNQAPLSSRTVRFISGVHFPPGVTNAPSGALYGIENTNRGCDLNLSFNARQDIAPARSTNGLPCNAFDASGCGPGIVTGKPQPDDGAQINAGGIPLYRIVPPGLDRVREGIVSNGQLVGAIGIAGVAGDSQRAEFAAVTGAFAGLANAIVPVPQYPLPKPGNVFIDGIRLPFLGPDLKLTFNSDGLPNGVERLSGTTAGNDAGAYHLAPVERGNCAPNGWLVGPNGGSGAPLTASDVAAIVDRAIFRAKRTRAAIRLPLNSYTRMVIAVADLDGTILGLYRMPDATVFSIDVAVAKARNVVWFSGSDPAVRNDVPGVPAGTAVTNRTIGFASQPYFPAGIDSGAFDVRRGPFYPTLYLRDLARPCSLGSQPAKANQNGIVFFAGATPLYRGSTLIGGLGVSGDGVEQDDYVTYHAAGEHLPPPAIWADHVQIDGVRLPMFKFPRQPEGVRECGGGPCS